MTLLVRWRDQIVKAPIDAPTNVSGSVLIPTSVSPTNIKFHFICFKLWYGADIAAPLSDTESSRVYAINAK